VQRPEAADAQESFAPHPGGASVAARRELPLIPIGTQPAIATTKAQHIADFIAGSR
jgi:hypothetical protein